MSSPTATPVLYIWPAKWNLPTIDVSCLAVLLMLQYTIPGAFTVRECANPDDSPSGQLPFLVHEHHALSTLPAIIRYVTGLKSDTSFATFKTDIDAFIRHPNEKATLHAWSTHVESNLGDLLLHMLYSLKENWDTLTHPALVSMLPIPHRYFVPSRIRESVRPRLETAGLWSYPETEPMKISPFRMQKPEAPDDTKKFQNRFEREKVLEKAKSLFDLYTRLLGNQEFVYGQLSSLDIILAAHTTLLLEPPFPDALLKAVLLDSYPALVQHSKRIYGNAMQSPPLTTRESFSVKTLVPWSLLFPGNKQGKNAVARSAKSEDDIQFDRMRWGWIAFAVGSLLYTAFKVGVIRIQSVEPRRQVLDTFQGGQFVSEDNENQEDDEDEDDQDEL